MARSAYLHINHNELRLTPQILEQLSSVCVSKQANLGFEMPAVLRWVPGYYVGSSLIVCLSAGFESECSDSRDKVFAVLNLMTQEVRSAFSVDYTLSSAAVHCNAVTEVVLYLKSLEILRFTDNPPVELS